MDGVKRGLLEDRVTQGTYAAHYSPHPYSKMNPLNTREGQCGVDHTGNWLRLCTQQVHHRS